MKFSILVEDEKKGTYKIPITKEEIEGAYDQGYQLILTEDEYKKVIAKLKKDKWDKVFAKDYDKFCKFHLKLSHLIHDVIHDGKTHSMEKTEKGDFKTKLNKKRSYYVKKPKWKK